MTFIRNQFRSQKNIKRGVLAKGIGDLFENMLRNSCLKSQIVCTRIPDGCKMIRTRSGAVLPKRTTTPFDFLLTKKGKSACIDCKTVDSGNFSHSMLTQHQVHSLLSIHDSDVTAGYVVWFRDTNQVVFYSADKLYHLKARQSLKTEDGTLLGDHNNFSLKSILEQNKVQNDQ